MLRREVQSGSDWVGLSDLDKEDGEVKDAPADEVKVEVNLV